MTETIFWILVIAAAGTSAMAHELRDINGTGFRWKRFVGRSSYLALKGLTVGLIGDAITDYRQSVLAAVILLTLVDFPERRLLALLHPVWGTADESSNPQKRQPDP